MPDPYQRSDEVVERFHSTSGRVSGLLVVLLALAVIVQSVVDPEGSFGPAGAAAAAVVAVLAWAAMVRPALWVTSSDLVMRNMFETVRLPLMAIDHAVVGPVLSVTAGQRRYLSPVVSRSLRMRMAGRARVQKLPDYRDFVEERIARHADDARAKAGVAARSTEQAAMATFIERRPCWPVIGLQGATMLALVMLLVI